MSIALQQLPNMLRQHPDWAALSDGLRSGSSGTIDGAWGSSASLAVAALSKNVAGTLLVLLPNVSELAPWEEDLATFLEVRPSLFPAHETWPPTTTRGQISPEASRRLRLLQELINDPPKLILAPMAAIMQSVPARESLQASGRRIRTGDRLELQELAEWLVERGYKRVDSVEFAGEFSQRGGICDIYPPDLNDPIRFEFFGDELESIRTFNTQTQRSLGKLDGVVILPASDSRASLRDPNELTAERSTTMLIDYLPEHSVVAMVEPGDLKEQSKHFYDRTANPVGLYAGNELFAYIMQRPTVTISALPRPSVEQTVHLKVESVERFSGNVQRVRDELDAIASRDVVMIACQTDAECHRLTEVLQAGKLAESQRLQLTTGHVRAGFRLVDLSPLAPGGEGLGASSLSPLAPGGEGLGVRGKTTSRSQKASDLASSEPLTPGPSPLGGEGNKISIVVLGSHELFHRDPVAASTKEKSRTASRSVEGRAIDSFLDLNEGDYVVHVAHGIAKFIGMKMLEKGNTIEMLHPDWGETPSDKPQYEENLILEFRGGMLLYVPASRIDLVQKYVGGQHTLPELSKLGGTAWKNKKEKVSEAVRDMAAEMIQIQALRGIAHRRGNAARFRLAN